MWVLLTWLLLAAAPVEGVYVAQQHETATALELEPGGRYRWFYSQGALDLSSEGRWRLEGNAVIIEGDPVQPPQFSFAGSGPTAAPGFGVKVVTTSDDPVPAVEVRVRYRSGMEETATTDQSGLGSFRLEAADPPQQITLALPMFEFRSAPFPVSAKTGETLRFELSPNDIGKQPFPRERLAVTDEGVLTLAFRGAALNYRRQENGLEEIP
jgi:hypothetical protein